MVYSNTEVILGRKCEGFQNGDRKSCLIRFFLCSPRGIPLSILLCGPASFLCDLHLVRYPLWPHVKWERGGMSLGMLEVSLPHAYRSVESQWLFEV